MSTLPARARYRNVTSLDVMRIDRRERVLAERRMPRVDTSRAEIMAALDDIREMLEIFRPLQRQALGLMDDYRREAAEVARLSQEVAGLQGTLAAVRQELAAIGQGTGEGSVTGMALARQRDLDRYVALKELSAVGDETAHAAGDILGAAEIIAGEARRLKQSGEPENVGSAESIMGQLIKLYEACNYQDLTQQRVAKIRRHIEGLAAHLDELTAILQVAPRQMTARRAANDARLLNGPAVAGTPGHLQQNEIDGYFK